MWDFGEGIEKKFWNRSCGSRWSLFFLVVYLVFCGFIFRGIIFLDILRFKFFFFIFDIIKIMFFIGENLENVE